MGPSLLRAISTVFLRIPESDVLIFPEGAQFRIVSMLAVEGAFHAGPGLQFCGLSRCVSFIFPSHCLIPERLPDGVVAFMFSQC